MPDLIHSLQGRDLGHLRIVADLWGVSLHSGEPKAALEELAAALLQTNLCKEVVESLAWEAQQALHALLAAGGRLPWAVFVRQAGDLDAAGAGRRDREQVHLHPASAAEILFYRALIGRAFFDTSSGLQEFAYIPDDLLNILQQVLPLPVGNPEEGTGAPGRLATPHERQDVLPLHTRLLDDATTLLAALRMEMEPPSTEIPAEVLLELLHAAGILEDGQPRPEALRLFLEMPRTAALKELVQAWRESRTFNELRLLPDLLCEGEWQNDPLATRRLLLDLLRRIPRGRWWSLPAFIMDIKTMKPDLQRSGGDYDAWFIKRRSDGTYLRGFGAWEQVEGTLIRFLVCGPMAWLGLVQLARPAGEEQVTAFLIPPGSGAHAQAEDGRLQVTSQGLIQAPRSLPRSVRYQLARFCEWEPEKKDAYRYRVSIASLARAKEQGLQPGHLLSLLAKHAVAEIPPAFVRAVKRWEKNGTEARLDVRTILQVRNPQVLEELRRSKAGRFLGEVLGPVTMTVQPGAKARVLAALAELGLLAEETEGARGGAPGNKGL